MRRLAYVVMAASLLAACHKKERQQEQQKQMEAQIEQRAAQLATQQAQKMVADDESRRKAAAQHALDEKQALRKKVQDSPGDFFDVGELRVVKNGNFQVLASVQLTNKSEFAVTDVTGALELHGDVDRPGGGDVVASVPVLLTGSIAAGASMRFSAKEHNLDATAIQLPKAPSQATFRVTAVRQVAPLDDGSAAAAAGGSAGM